MVREIALSNTSCSFEFATRLAIDNKGKISGTNTTSYPFLPTVSKTFDSHHFIKIFPINFIKSFLNIDTLDILSMPFLNNFVGN